MKTNSIATSIEQSEKLLDIGIDPNSASMTWVSLGKNCEWMLNLTPYKDNKKDKFWAYRPAWTLGDMLHIICADRPGIKLLFYCGALTYVVRHGRNYTWYLDENKAAIDLLAEAIDMLVDAIIELKKENVI